MVKKIRVEDLETGMYISDLNTPWLRHPFFPKRLALRDRRDIDRMLRCGMAEVHIDTRLGKDSPKAVPLEEVEREQEKSLRHDAARDAAEPEQRTRVPFSAEFRRARILYAEARTSVRRQFEGIASGGRVDAESAHHTATHLIASIFRNGDALLSLARLRRFDEYTFHHSLNVAVLALNLSVRLGILDAELLRLGMGAVLHDLGKVKVPGPLIRKEGPLDPGEFELMKSHAAQGAKLLLEERSLPTDCASVPLSHHERYDGSGYPRRLSGVRVGKFGLITAIADVYDAMTSDRPYQKGMSPTRALKRIYGWRGTHFHPLYVEKFIQCVGIYPIGTAVRLDTGEVGVVVKQSLGDLARPWVRLARRATGEPLTEPFDVDLRAPDPGGDRLFARSVAGVLEPAVCGLDVERLLALEPPSHAPDERRTLAA